MAPKDPVTAPSPRDRKPLSGHRRVRARNHPLRKSTHPRSMYHRPEEVGPITASPVTRKPVANATQRRHGRKRTRKAKGTDTSSPELITDRPTEAQMSPAARIHPRRTEESASNMEDLRLVVSDVGQESKVSCPLDRPSKLSLEPRRNLGRPAWQDLP